MGTTVPGIVGVPRGVLLAALATSIGALPVLAGVGEPSLPTGALFCAGWPALGLTAAVLLDREPGSRLGRTLALFAMLPAALVLAGMLLVGTGSTWDRLGTIGEQGALLLVLAMLVAVGWAVGLTDTRTSRRRLVWLVFWSCLLMGAITATSILAPPRTLATVMALGLWAFAAVVLRLATTSQFRPIDEPILDAAVVVAPLLLGAVVAVGVRFVGARADIPILEFSTAFAAVVTTALALPAGLWLRRSFLERRYGPGSLDPEDVRTVTADLSASTDPRELLGKAAAMIQSATGHRGVRLILGADPFDPPEGWIVHPLDVGSDRVGVLLVLPSNPEGPEPHQDRIVRRMLPTIALMTRAVELAVRAELARRDVARERDQERSRILSDLHDGVGPQLAGLSMAVQAELRRSPSPLLASVADGLSEARSDLRRIVSGLTPSALEDADLSHALAELVGSFAGQGGRVTLEADLRASLDPGVAVAVYRSVAEGVANALRHGQAEHVAVRVAADGDGTVRVDIRDDGTGGAIVPGVGLTSLRRRAESLGGGISISTLAPKGVHLQVQLPGGAAA